jgi:hypothetical protein
MYITSDTYDKRIDFCFPKAKSGKLMTMYALLNINAISPLFVSEWRKLFEALGNQLMPPNRQNQEGSSRMLSCYCSSLAR